MIYGAQVVYSAQFFIDNETPKEFTFNFELI